MKLVFNEQQEMMRKSFKSFLEKSYPIQNVRLFMEEEKPFDQELWNGMKDLGIPGILVDEAYGGLGLSPIDQLVILEEAGRYLTPAPIKASALAACLLSRAANAENYAEQLNGISEGTTLVTTGFLEKNGKWDTPSVTQVKADGASSILHGSKMNVPFAAASQFVLITAQDDQGKAGLYLVPLQADGVSIRRLQTVDHTLPFYEVNFEQVRLGPNSKLLDGDTALIPYAMELGAIFTCAESIGGMERVLSVSVEYAKERVQFGKPIGSFQAIKHKLADMLVGIEKMKAMTYYAALETVEGNQSRGISIASAKVLCAQNYHFITKQGVQVHGGMGFTWENDMHLYVRRAMVNQTEFGSPGQHHQMINQQLDNIGNKYTKEVSAAST